MFPVCASDGRAGLFFWRENDFVANLDKNVNINIKEVVFFIKITPKKAKNSRTMLLF